MLQDLMVWLITGLCAAEGLLWSLPECLRAGPQIGYSFTHLVLVAHLAYSAMNAHLLWRHSLPSEDRIPHGALPWFWRSFWLFMLRESVVGITTVLSSAAVWFRASCGGSTWRSVTFFSISKFIMACVVMTQIGAVPTPQRLCRRRPGWCWQFAGGFSAGLFCLFVPVIGSALDPGSIAINIIFEFAGLFITIVFAFLIRDAAIFGFFAVDYLELWWLWWWTIHPQTRPLVWEKLVQDWIPNTMLIVAAGAAETSRDLRLLLSWLFLIGNFDPFTNTWLKLAVNLCIGHAVNWNMRGGRNMRPWTGAIAFLKFSEIKLRRQADRRFVLSRRQDMAPEVYGDPKHATYIFVVSHPWLSAEHADPDGIHLDLLLALIEEKFGNAYARSGCNRWWRRYYYLRSEGDVLIFFDMSSLPQAPRAPQEEADFKQALGLMNFLFYSFDVLVITEIPADAPSFGTSGVRLAFFDKGWCWAEGCIARLGGQLDQFSQPALRELERETRSLTTPFSESLLGEPNYPEELLQSGKECQLLDFRKTQSVKGKLFTNGKHDAPQVAKILARVEGLQKFRSHLQRGQHEAVLALFRDLEFLMQSGLTGKELANVVFDGAFNTPLHLAVAGGNAGLVRALFAEGARPRRNFLGRFPWEGRCGVPLLSDAAFAAMRPNLIVTPPIDVQMSELLR